MTKKRRPYLSSPSCFAGIIAVWHGRAVDRDRATGSSSVEFGRPIGLAVDRWKANRRRSKRKAMALFSDDAMAEGKRCLMRMKESRGRR
ncbi:hypothetical protein OPV22_006702 [Ensete ventricosum]|uniref:VAN3-binding protein-like auxin canalisation domain-containing protein n=1 Tax=Ensete ventricosum TaxID=4639 RepID=A0AAV8RS96_ENSVE|nr:hypothetical protein OPV22_006702 [Ensete ventricosum]